MKRWLKLSIACTAVLMGACFASAYASTSNPVHVAYAETSEEVTSEEAPSAEEEVSKWKQLYEEAVKKINEAKQTEFLGTTVGAIVGGLIVFGLSWLSNKLNRENIRSLQEFGRNALDKSKEMNNKGQEYLIKAEKAMDEVIILQDTVKELIKANNVHKEAVEQIIKEERKASQEKIDALLTIISNVPELVANGTAEKIYNLYHK